MEFTPVYTELESVQRALAKAEHSVNLNRLRLRCVANPKLRGKFHKLLEDASTRSCELKKLAEHCNTCLEVSRVAQLPFVACEWLMLVQSGAELLALEESVCSTTGSRMTRIRRGTDTCIMHQQPEGLRISIDGAPFYTKHTFGEFINLFWLQSDNLPVVRKFVSEIIHSRKMTHTQYAFLLQHNFQHWKLIAGLLALNCFALHDVKYDRLQQECANTNATPLLPRKTAVDSQSLLNISSAAGQRVC